MAERTPWQKLARRIRVPLGFVCAAVFLVWARPVAFSMLLGLPFVLAGLALRAYASGYVRKNTELATTGPYAYTRNPLYLGSLLILLGFGMAAANVWLVLLLLALFLAIYLPTIASEEQYLRAHFPNFEAYRAQVPKLLPRLTRGRLGEESGAFSRELYLQHREYNSAVGALAIYAALVGRLLLGSYAELDRLARGLQAYLGG